MVAEVGSDGDTKRGAPVIEARDLSLTFQTNDGPVHALKDVNLSVERGEFVSFIGPSGCGKTTLLRAIAALEMPTAGTLSVNGLWLCVPGRGAVSVADDCGQYPVAAGDHGIRPVGYGRARE